MFPGQASFGVGYQHFWSRISQAPQGGRLTRVEWSQSPASPFLRVFNGPIYTSAPSARPIFPQELGRFCTKPRYMVKGVRQLCISKVTHAHVQVDFFLQRSLRMIIIAAISCASFVRNRGARKRAMFLQDDQRRVRPRTEEKDREIEGRNAAWLILAGAQTVVAAVEQAANQYQSQTGQGQTPSKGSAKSDIGSWFAKRASSNQSGQGGQQQQAIIERQGKLLAIVNKPSIAKQKNMLGQLLKMYTTPDQLLPVQSQEN